MRRILVTSALPYANGDIHIGHLVEYIQTDIFVRFQKLRGNECAYICADDTHGTPIMISAKKQGITPEELIARCHERHARDFAAFGVAFDNFYTTHSPENRELASAFFLAMKQKGHIREAEIEQLYCEKDAMFLPDRFVRGVCPRCGAADQYGDSCEACSATYNPIDLKQAACSLCGTAPVPRKSTHFFFKLGDFEAFLKEWTGPAHLLPELRKKLDEWFAEGLKDWDVSRDAPYFGFTIPGTTDKYFYVWLDAPIGYIASTKNWAERNGRTLESVWQNPEWELYHFLGKDILYFHTLFWPAMLHAAGYKTPNFIFVHGFLRVDNEKMSKSRGTFINAATYLKHLDPQYLRYYYASKLAPGADDLNLSLEDFRLKVNADLVGKLANIGSRVAGMLTKRLGGRMGTVPEDGKPLLASLRAAADGIADDYERLDYGRAIKRILDLAGEVNKYNDGHEPWKLVTADPERARAVITTVLNAFRLLSVYLKPVLPAFVADVEAFMNLGPLDWDSLAVDLEDHVIGEFKHLVKRIEEGQIEAMVRESAEEKAPAAGGTAAPAAATPESLGVEPLTPECTIDDFGKVDLRVAKVIAAEGVEGANKLLKLTLDVGFCTRQVFAGIKKFYTPEQMVGRLVILVANLKPRQMKFGLSEGMILCASNETTCRILEPDEGAFPGLRIH